MIQAQQPSNKMIFSVRQHHLLALLLVMATCWSALPADARTTSTTSEPTPVIEDTFNSATSESSEEEENPCEQCYDRVENAQTFITVQLELLERQRYLIRQKQKTASSNSIVKSSTTKRPRPQQNQTASGRSRSLLNNDNSDELIVVSRLRVARSTDSNNSLGRTQSDVKARRKPKKNIDPELKQLEHKQKQNLNETCKSLYELKNCLTELSSECIGDLQYHSFGVFYDQWMTKFNCPPINNPSFKPFRALTRSIPQLDREKVPIARPITSPEEVQKRLDAVFGGRSALGVMLNPTMTMSATQKFNSLSLGGLQQQKFDGDAYSQTKGRHLLPVNQILEVKVPKQSGAQLKPMTTQLILIPGLLIFMLALLTLANRYYKAAPQKA